MERNLTSSIKGWNILIKKEEKMKGDPDRKKQTFFPFSPMMKEKLVPTEMDFPKMG